MKNSFFYTIFVVLIIAALMLVGCQKSTITGNSVADIPVAPTNTSEEVEELPSLVEDHAGETQYMDGDVKVFKITAKDMKFEPYTITVKKGDKVRMLVTAEDRTYNFQLAEFHVKGTVEQGQTTTVEFVANMADAFSFYSRREWNGGKIDRLGMLVVKVQ